MARVQKGAEKKTEDRSITSLIKSKNSTSLHISATIKKQWTELDGTRFNRNLVFIRVPDGVLFRGTKMYQLIIQRCGEGCPHRFRRLCILSGFDCTRTYYPPESLFPERCPIKRGYGVEITLVAQEPKSPALGSFFSEKINAKKSLYPRGVPSTAQGARRTRSLFTRSSRSDLPYG